MRLNAKQIIGGKERFLQANGRQPGRQRLFRAGINHNREISRRPDSLSVDN
jgi:hypothetical protein